MAQKKTTKKTTKKAKKERKPKVKDLKCKKCGHSFPPNSEEGLKHRKKTWTFVSPMPDKNGDVTITAMASFNCPNCGKNITGAYGKTKGDFGGKSKTERIKDLLDTKVPFQINEFAKEIGVEGDNLAKILTMMIKKGSANGKITSGEFIPN